MKITIKDASNILGKSPQFVRIGLQRGILPIGTAVKMKRWVYHISEKKLIEYIGLEQLNLKKGENNG